jgi:hypothetical protein
MLEVQRDVGSGAGRVVRDQLKWHPLRAEMRKEFFGTADCPSTLIDDPVEIDEKRAPIGKDFQERIG